ncbi:MAG: hypothetical protein ACFE95_02325 [Candidatus Hodarchaeota archaeon]
MSYISPSVLRDFITCPRFFQYRWLFQLPLVPSIESQFERSAQERINNFTFGFFSNLKTQWSEENVYTALLDINCLFKSYLYTHLDIYANVKDQNTQELDEKVFTLLLWLILQLSDKNPEHEKMKSKVCPIFINDLIQAPNLRLRGRPSAVFLYPNNNTLIFIQSYHQVYPHTSDFDILQASMYARILTEMGLRVKHFLSVNYSTMALIFREFNQKDFNDLDEFLLHFQSCLEEREFIPPKLPPCPRCEFIKLCRN